MPAFDTAYNLARSMKKKGTVTPGPTGKPRVDRVVPVSDNATFHRANAPAAEAMNRMLSLLFPLGQEGFALPVAPPAPGAASPAGGPPGYSPMPGGDLGYVNGVDERAGVLGIAPPLTPQDRDDALLATHRAADEASAPDPYPFMRERAAPPTPTPMTLPPVRDTAAEQGQNEGLLRTMALMSLFGGGYNPTAVTGALQGQGALQDRTFKESLTNWQQAGDVTQTNNQNARQAWNDSNAVADVLDDQDIKRWQATASLRATTAAQQKALATLQRTLSRQQEDREIKLDDARREWVQEIMAADPASKEALVSLLEQRPTPDTPSIAERLGLKLRDQNGKVLVFNRFYASVKTPEDKAMANVLALLRSRQPLTTTLPILNEQMAILGMPPLTAEQVTKMSRLEEAKLAEILSRNKYRGLAYGQRNRELDIREGEAASRALDRAVDQALGEAKYGMDAAGLLAKEADEIADDLRAADQDYQVLERQIAELEARTRPVPIMDPRSGVQAIDPRTKRPRWQTPPVAPNEIAALNRLKTQRAVLLQRMGGLRGRLDKKREEARRAVPPTPFPVSGTSRPTPASVPRAIKRHAPVVQRVAQENNLDPDILYTLIEMESGGRADALNVNNNPSITNPKGRYWNTRDMGLLQLNSLEYGTDWNWQDPYTNASKGAKHFLNKYRQAGGDLQEAFRRYNGSGPAARRYSQKAMGIYNRLKGGVRVRETTRTGAGQTKGKRVSAIDRPSRQTPEGFETDEETGIAYRVVA